MVLLFDIALCSITPARYSAGHNRLDYRTANYINNLSVEHNSQFFRLQVPGQLPRKKISE